MAKHPSSTKKFQLFPDLLTNCYFGEYVEVGVIHVNHVTGESTKFTTSTYSRTNLAMEESRTDEELREDLTRLSDEVLRLEASVTTLQDSLLQMGDKVKEVGTLKDTVMVCSMAFQNLL